MSIYGSMLAPKASSPWTDAFLAGDDLPNAWGPYGTVAVDGTASLQQSTVYSCVRVIAEDVASLPLHIYRRLDGGGKERDAGHPLYGMLHDAPNPEMSSGNFWETMVGWCASWGNAFAQIQFDRLDRPLYLWPLRSDRMRLRRNDRRELIYEYRYEDKAKPDEFPADEIFHLRGWGANGILGYSPIQVAGGPVLLALAAERFGINFFQNGSRPGGVVTMKTALSDPARQRFKTEFEALYRGVENAHRIAVLEEEAAFTPFSIPQEDAQFLETRKYQRSEIAGLFRMQPHMIADLDRSTNNNIEQQSLEHVTYTLRPWLIRIEREIKRQLMPERTHFVEFLVDGLLRGDAEGRARSLQIQRQNGALNADEWREIENRNPLPDGSGQVYWQPVNMMEAGAEPPSGGDQP